MVQIEPGRWPGQYYGEDYIARKQEEHAKFMDSRLGMQIIPDGMYTEIVRRIELAEAQGVSAENIIAAIKRAAKEGVR